MRAFTGAAALLSLFALRFESLRRKRAEMPVGSILCGPAIAAEAT
jgi:hypothetical protein